MSYEDYEDLLAEDTFDYVEDTFIEAVSPSTSPETIFPRID